MIRIREIFYHFLHNIAEQTMRKRTHKKDMKINCIEYNKIIYGETKDVNDFFQQAVGPGKDRDLGPLWLLISDPRIRIRTI
jgi:hypothetical protein